MLRSTSRQLQPLASARFAAKLARALPFPGVSCPIDSRCAESSSPSVSSGGAIAFCVSDRAARGPADDGFGDNAVVREDLPLAECLPNIPALTASTCLRKASGGRPCQPRPVADSAPRPLGSKAIVPPNRMPVAEGDPPLPPDRVPVGHSGMATALAWSRAVHIEACPSAARLDVTDPRLKTRNCSSLSCRANGRRRFSHPPSFIQVSERGFAGQNGTFRRERTNKPAPAPRRCRHHQTIHTIP